jgi:hypothetical protein
MISAENERQYRTLDLMLSMHASLGQRYNRRAVLLNSALLAASAILCSLTFAPEDLLSSFGIAAKGAKFMVGGASAVIFALSIIELRVNWQHIGMQHIEAANKLAALKTKYRDCYALPMEQREPVQRTLSEDYATVMQALPLIPDRWFATLKAEHLFKRELSSAIDHAPTAPLWLLKGKLRWRGISTTVKNDAARRSCL